MILDARFAGDDIIRNHRAPHLLAKLDLRPVGLKLAAPDQHGPASHLQRIPPLLVLIPLHEAAIAEAHRALARDLRDLIARPPEGTVHKPHAARVGPLHPHHRRVRAVEGDELTVGNQQRHGGTVLDHQSRIAVVRADAQEVAVADAAFRLHELIAHVVAEAERVIDILPVSATEDKRLSMLLLPFEQLRLHAPPRIEVHVLDPPDVVDAVHVNTPPQGLAVDIPDQVPLVLAGVNAVVGVEQLHCEHRRVLAAHRDRPGIWLRLLGRVLLGIINNDALQRAVVIQGDKGGSILLASTLGDEKRGAVVRRFDRASISNPRVGWN